MKRRDFLGAVGASGFALGRGRRARAGAIERQYPHGSYGARQELSSARLGCGRYCRIVGFADLTNFTRLFKRIIGLTPGEYSKLVRPSTPCTSSAEETSEFDI